MAKILLVDDDEDFLELMRNTLELAGQHVVRTAVNGHAALAEATSWTPDLIVSDVVMPKMNGWALFKAAREAGIEVPFMFTSALGSDTGTRVKGLRLGADDFIAKPVDPEEFLLRVDNMFGETMLILEEPDGRLPDADMRGNLGRIGLTSLLVMFEVERRSGVLVLGHGGETMWLTLHKGAPVAAELTGAFSVSGIDALTQALDWRTGTFEFADRETPPEDDIGRSTTHILLDHARARDELDAAQSEGVEAAEVFEAEDVAEVEVRAARPPALPPRNKKKTT